MCFPLKMRCDMISDKDACLSLVDTLLTASFIQVDAHCCTIDTWTRRPAWLETQVWLGGFISRFTCVSIHRSC